MGTTSAGFRRVHEDRVLPGRAHRVPTRVATRLRTCVLLSVAASCREPAGPGRQECERESVARDGVVAAAWCAKGDVLDGEWVSNHPNGVIALRGGYVNGVPEGLWVMFDQSGRRMLSLSYSKGELAEGDSSRFSSLSDGVCGPGRRLKKVVPLEDLPEAHCLNGDAIADGPLLQFDANGHLTQVGWQVDGKRSGLWIGFRDGRKISESRYRIGAADGISIETIPGRAPLALDYSGGRSRPVAAHRSQN